MDNEKRYLIICRIGQTDPSMPEIASVAAPVKDALDRLSTCKPQSAFTTHRGDTFAFFVKTEKTADYIRALLYGQTNATQTSPLRNDDSALIIEIPHGANFSGSGFSRGWTWLQHH